MRRFLRLLPLALVLLPLGIVLLPGISVSTRRVELPPPSSDTRAYGAVVGTEGRAPLARAVDVLVTVQSGLRGIEAHADYTIVLSRRDPLIAAVDRGDVDGATLVGLLAGAPTGPTYVAPMIEYGEAGDLATLKVSSRPVQVRTWLLVEQTYEDSGGAGQVASRTLQIVTRDVELTRVLADGVPSSRNGDILRFGPGPVLSSLYVAVGVAPSAEEAAGAIDLLSLSRGPLLWHIAMAIPWLILLLRTVRSQHPSRGPLRVGALVYLIAVPALALVLWWTQTSSSPLRVPVRDAMLALILVVGPVMTAGWCRWLRGEPAFGGGLRRFVPVLAGVLVVAALALAADGPLAAWPSLAGGLAAAALLWAAARLAGRDRLVAAALGLAFVPGTLVVHFLFEQAHLTWGTFAAVGLGLLMVPVPVVLVRGLVTRWRRLATVLAGMLGAILIAPVVSVLKDPVRGLAAMPALQQPMSVGVGAATVLILVLLVVLTARLLADSRDTGVFAEPLTRAAGIAVVVIAAIPAYITLLGPVVAALSLVIALQWLIPSSRVGTGTALADVTDAQHRTLVRAELWQRLLQRTAQQTYRGAPARVGTGEVKLDDIQPVWQKAIGPSEPTGALPLTRSALGSGGGVTPRENLLFGAATAAVLALPIMTYEGWLVFFSADPELAKMTTATLLQALARLLRWIAYGGVFGLFYPVLRGDSPTAKGGFLVLALLPSELLSMATAPYSPAQTVWYALLIRTGQVAVLSIGLGLWWERRLARAAGLRWGQLRDFRSFGALVTPVTTVLVAAATTVATTLAGAAVGTLLKPSPAAPSAPTAPATSIQPSR